MFFLDFEHYDAQLERRSGAIDYVEILRFAHAVLQPALYLEIGVYQGASLSLAQCSAIGIDPEPELDQVPDNAQLFRETSDDFFKLHAEAALTSPPDLVFIDGMHLFEYALRDFMNAESCSHPATAIVIDDVYPNHPVQADRDRKTLSWCGDVWKIADCLRRYRPELQVLGIDSYPAGLLLVTGLDPTDRVLAERYEELVATYARPDLASPPRSVIDRRGAVSPWDSRLGTLVESLREARVQGLDAGAVSASLRGIIE